jgi:hypothetical protein
VVLLSVLEVVVDSSVWGERAKEMYGVISLVYSLLTASVEARPRTTSESKIGQERTCEHC